MLGRPSPTRALRTGDVSLLRDCLCRPTGRQRRTEGVKQQPASAAVTPTNYKVQLLSVLDHLLVFIVNTTSYHQPHSKQPTDY